MNTAMHIWRAQIRPHPYPRDLDLVAQDFGRQLDGYGCGAAALHHGLLFGGLTIPKAALHAMFRVYPDGIDGERLNAYLQALGLEPDYREKPSGESTQQFLERLGQEMDRGAFVLACIAGGRHWITLGRWQDGRIRVVDSYVARQWFPSWTWDLGMYSLTPEEFDQRDWEDCVQLVRPGIWHKNYQEWLPGRDRLLRLAGHSLETSASMLQRLQFAAHEYLNHERYNYDQLEFCFSEKSSMAVRVEDPRSQAISIHSPPAKGPEGQVIVVRRLAHCEPEHAGPPELIFRLSALRGWQLLSPAARQSGLGPQAMTPLERLGKAVDVAAAAGIAASRAMTPAQLRASTFRNTRGRELPHFEGWHLLGAFPDYAHDDVGSWLLVHNGKALLLEVPPGLSADVVDWALDTAGVSLRFVTASHDHEDHLDRDAWEVLRNAFPKVEFIHPSTVSGDRLLHVGGEPLWLIKAPKHSWTDVVTVFRGVAMIGEIELGTLASAHREVFCQTKMKSMEWLRGFQDRTGHHIHSVVNAHLNDVRLSVNWPDLFEYSYSAYLPPDPSSPQYGKRWQCRIYGCWGRLVPIEADAAWLGCGYDMICEDCGCPDWSDPRKK
jgi:hydroxyacylglutathione hydrolase